MGAPEGWTAVQEKEVGTAADRTHLRATADRNRPASVGGGAPPAYVPQRPARPEPLPDRATHAAYLRIEYFSNQDAQALGWAVFLSTLLLIATTVILVVFKFSVDHEKVLFKRKTWYVVNASVAGFCTLCLLAVLAWFAANLRLTRAARRDWSNRRKALSRNALLLLVNQVVAGVFWVTPYAVTAAYRCAWFDDSIAWLSLGRWTMYNCCFFGALAMTHECCRYRGPDPPTNPDEQLVMDITAGQKLRAHVPKMLLWLALQALIVTGTVFRLQDDNDTQADRQACESLDYSCESPVTIQIAEIVQLVLVTLYALWYAFYLWRAFQDHAVLPFARYRLSNIYIRLMARHGIAAFFCVLFSIIVLTTVQFQTCWSYLDASLGIAPVQMSLGLLVAVQVVTLIPKQGNSRDLLTTCMQRFSWTLEGLPAAIAAREEERRRAEAAPAGLHRLLSGGRRIMRHSVGQAVLQVPDVLGGWHLAGAFRTPAEHDQAQQHEAEQDQQQQQQQANCQHQPQQAKDQAQEAPQDQRHGQEEEEEQQQQEHNVQQQQHQDHHQERRGTAEPMFCLELAVRLFYWTKYAYRHWLGAAGHMDQGTAQRLFGFTHFEAFHDCKTDTRALLSWRDDGALLLAFRGTASTANALTDLKAWTTPVLPRRYHGGRLVKAHAGFYHAYTLNDDRHKLLSRIQAIVAGLSGGTAAQRNLRLYLTGHSLGGALAILAAYDLQQLFPQAHTTVYTFGAPRAGNRAFAAEYRSLVPDSWGLVNDQDPVPRMPTVGFRHCCQPVVVNARGDIIVRPSYFEREVLSRSGGVLGHHMLLRYALSFAAVLKAQFSSSKWLPGGGAGATALALALDLNTTLLLRNVDLDSLRNPVILPESSEKPASSSKGSKEGSVASCTSARLLSLCAGAPPAAQKDQEEELKRAADELKEGVEGMGREEAAEVDGRASIDGWEVEEESGKQEDNEQHERGGRGAEAAHFAADATALAGQAAAGYLTAAADVVNDAAEVVADAASAAHPPMPLMDRHGRYWWWHMGRKERQRKQDLEDAGGISAVPAAADPPVPASVQGPSAPEGELVDGLGLESTTTPEVVVQPAGDG